MAEQKKFLDWCRSGKVQKVETAIKDGLDINVHNKDGKTPLIVAVEHNQTAVVAVLLANSVEVDAIDKYRMTPLHYASFHGHHKLCQQLIDAGADIDAKDAASLTPLHEAASAGKVMVTRVLIRNGASLTVEDQHHNTALDLAKQFKRTTCIKDLQTAMQQHQQHRKRKSDQSNTPIRLSPHSSILSVPDNDDDDDHKKKKNKKKKLKKRSSNASAASASSSSSSASNNTKMSKKHMTESEKLKSFLTEVNLFEADDRDKKMIAELQTQNQHLQSQVHTLQTQMDKLQKLQKSHSQLKAADADIAETIAECGNDVEKLKQKLYETMSVVKVLDAENGQLRKEIEALHKKHTLKMDALMSDYGEIRNELNEKTENKNAVNALSTASSSSSAAESHKTQHKRKSSKVLRKQSRFEKWMENDVALPQYVKHFHDSQYDRFDVVVTLTETDLKEIGISKIGHRRLIMDKIKELPQYRKDDYSY